MADGAAHAVMALVVALLAVGVWRQFARIGRTGRRLDQLALVPQWRFYAQGDIDGDAAFFDDPHLVVRTRTADGSPGEWTPLLWPEERRLIHSVWNPQRRSFSQLQEFLLVLCQRAQQGHAERQLTAIPYLSILRFCVDHAPPGGGAPLQFAIALTRGRDDRPLTLGFCSAWHSR